MNILVHKNQGSFHTPTKTLQMIEPTAFGSYQHFDVYRHAVNIALLETIIINPDTNQAHPIG